jgi:serine/threonine protein kinase
MEGGSGGTHEEENVDPKLPLALMSSPRGSYELIRQIGDGSFSEVFLARRALSPEASASASSPKGICAIKRIDKRKLRHDGPSTRLCLAEATVLRSLAHTNVVKSYDAFDDGPYHCIVLEHAEGGDLLTFVNERTRLSERRARRYTHQVALALQHARNRGFVHRDLKLENVLLDASYERVLLADWGFACAWRRDRRIAEPVGSLLYSAPEIFAEESYIGPELDAWSLGVVLYAMVAGELPFFGKSDNETRLLVMAGMYAIPEGLSISRGCRELIASLLTVDSAERATVEDVLSHEWVRGSDLRAQLPQEAIGSVQGRIVGSRSCDVHEKICGTSP